ncbi:acyloxyacyl hydrolase [Adhaeribacter sp. BT258]|uniref:Acyloxyacyl hydrolase n=1 Tax=Adhaeribacter terrigena TaxID=2793070 RepID=A0ABS1C1Y0_9BACT|nr:acyloxyacyl hydrolase [Adhaeribacter terrigena]MBK0403408.1 acyloxyacyl hydrolase [Adhaeribacter terrigena]
MRVWLLVFFAFFSSNVFAQRAAQPWVLGAYANGGFIIAHSPLMQHLAVSHPTGFELNVQKQTTGKKAWHQLYQFPKVGYSLVYFHYHNPKLGRSVAASTYINKTLWRARKGELNYRLGLGMAYLTEGYDQETNHKNSVASSALNATLQTRFEYDYRLAPHYSLLLGLGLNHYSNGATKKPNLGLNIPTLTFGVNFHTVPAFITETKTLPEFDPKLFYTLSTTAGWRQIGPLDTKKYLVQSVSFSVAKPLNRKSNLVLGAEAFFDRSLKVQQQTDTTLTGKPFPDTKKLGIFLGHELGFGDLALETQVGFYAYRPYKNGTPYYERLGLKYHFTPEIFTALDLKIHGFAADVLEYRLGYKF